jgi:hypothetical protein
MMFSMIFGACVAVALTLTSATANAHHFKHFHFPKPAPAPAPAQQSGPNVGHRSAPVFAIYTASAIGCGTLGLMAGSVGRQMKIEEAEYIVGNCFIPFVGGELFRYLRSAMNPPKARLHRHRHS